MTSPAALPPGDLHHLESLLEAPARIDGTDVAVWMLLVAAALAGAFAAWSLVRRSHRRRRSHLGSFDRMAGALGLSREQRKFIGRLAARARIGCPAALLISRGCFDRAAETSGGSASIDEIRRRIFG